MRNKVALPLAAVVSAVLVVVGFRASGLRMPTETVRTAGEQATAGGDALPKGVTLRQIDGGSHYYAHISQKSAWMDQHILLGAWLEQPLTAAEVKYDVAMGNNIYWNLAANPLDTKDCGGVQPCRVNFNVIREFGMHASAPDVTSESGSETVAYEGDDEVDMEFGPGAGGWNPDGPGNESSCIPSGSPCGYTVANFYYTGQPAKYGSTGYPSGQKPITQGYGKGVLFWESDSQAKTFLKYSDTLSADSYWMTDPDLNLPSQGGCALLPDSPTACGNGGGPGLATAERALPANYAYNVTRLQSLSVGSKPVTVDVETGCPGSNGDCTTPVATTAAAWHALIAGARGIIWFQQSFSGPCVDFNTFYDGSNPSSPMYKCQQTPGVTIHDVVGNVSGFNHEVASLNTVLLAPFAENYVNVGDADISVMAKYSKNVFYVFAASGKPADPPAKNQLVKFKLASDYTGPVTVINEHRVLYAVRGIFTDKFANAYTVHIYKMGKLFRGPASCRQG
jgi:hypothetical protein